MGDLPFATGVSGIILDWIERRAFLAFRGGKLIATCDSADFTMPEHNHLSYTPLLQNN